MDKSKYIERSISAVVLEAAQYFPVVCITGPRQSGKSTLIKHLFPNFIKYTLEDLDVRNYAKSDPVAFLNQTEEGMILDEVHKVPELLSYIQGIADDHPNRQFILSGSSNFALIRSVSQSLAGRVGMFDLLPMSMEETQKDTERKSLDELMFDGLYPSICAEKNIARLYYPSYVKTYLERDVREVVNVKDLIQFNTFLRLCAGRIGSVFKVATSGEAITGSPGKARLTSSGRMEALLLFSKQISQNVVIKDPQLWGSRRGSVVSKSD